MLRYIASSKINNKPLTDTKYDFSNIVEKLENWIGRTVHGPTMQAYKRKSFILLIYFNDSSCSPVVAFPANMTKLSQKEQMNIFK